MRFASLALLERAWARDWDMSPVENALWLEHHGLEGLPDEELMPTFMRLALKPGVPLPAPPPGDPRPWMATRPAGIRAIGAFKRGDIDREALRRFDRPVYFALGALTNPAQHAEIAKRLSGLFSDFELEVFEERHHFDPPTGSSPSALRTRSRHSGGGPG